MSMILFADDIVIFTTNPTSLQSQIDSNYHYSEQWGLKINVNKTNDHLRQLLNSFRLGSLKL